MKTDARPLNVLIVEDSEDDAALLELELQRAGYHPVCHRVERRETMEAALESSRWDLVISDYVLPHFNGLAALSLVKEKGFDLPFIVVSGHITDDTAVAAMKAGAHDYVMKDNLARLGSAVDRELREAEVRCDRRRSEERLKVEHAFRRAVENSVPSGISAVDLEGRQTYVNPAFCAMVGWSEAELVGARPPYLYWPPEEIETIAEALGAVVQGDAPASGIELRFRRRLGERFHVLLQATPLKDSYGNVTGWVSSVSDISERKVAEVRLAAEHAITRILANAQSLTEAGPGIVQVLLDSLEVDLGTLWAVDSNPPVLHPSVTSLRRLTPELKNFLQEHRRLSFAAGVGLPGRVWQERRAIWIADLSLEPEFDRRNLAASARLQSLFAFPILTAGDFFGVLEFFSQRSLEQDQTLLNMISAIGSEIGQFVQRRNAEEALRRAHDELEVRVQQRTAQLKTANTRLHASIAERKRLEHELLDITERERRRIGLDLHDDLGQKLSGLALMTKGLELKLAKRGAAETPEAARIHELVQEAMSHTKGLARDLATLDLQHQTLPEALKALAARASNLFSISCRFKSEGEVPSLEGNVTTQLYKIAQEAVTNAIKHGKAKRVAINLVNGSDQLTLRVVNSGVPFPDLAGQSTAGMGLRIMNYRASLIGGTVEIKGQGTSGTTVTCSVPLETKKETAAPAL
jgi:PAS domain S-box-containing protein